jgi:hypothetical protein
MERIRRAVTPTVSATIEVDHGISRTDRQISHLNCRESHMYRPTIHLNLKEIHVVSRATHLNRRLIQMDSGLIHMSL